MWTWWIANDCRFGIAAVTLEMVPFFSLAFAFSNTVGAALWAADMEREGGRADS